ncbi:hypothetical protein MRB53_014680 [Persea americana]|uniref:Uncharacterized protein n=1 Tax=Persea americana TaxID=3435 RepID=A0ACC2KC05_PERAE|nr:hypothetical protein MRB53_014680 [Persea americana]
METQSPPPQRGPHWCYRAVPWPKEESNRHLPYRKKKKKIFQSQGSTPPTLGFLPDMGMAHPQLHPLQHGFIQVASPSVGNHSDFLRRTISSQLTPMNRYKEPAPQWQSKGGLDLFRRCHSLYDSIYHQDSSTPLSFLDIWTITSLPCHQDFRWATLTRTTPIGRDPKTWTLQEVSSRWIRTTQGLMLLLKQLLLLQLLHWSSEELTLPSPSFSSRLLLGMSCCGVLHGCTKLPKTQLI